MWGRARADKPRPLHPLPVSLSGALLGVSSSSLPKWLEPLLKPLRHVGRRLAQLRKSRAGLLLYGLAAVFGLLQFVLVLELLGPSKYGAPDKPGDNLMSKSLGNEKVEVRDLWQKYFAHTDAVPWPDFAAHLLMHSSWEMRPLPAELRVALGPLFDVNKDGKVTMNEFQRCLLKHGQLGVEWEIEKVVNATLKHAAQKQQERLRPHSSRGCALALHGGFHNFVEVAHSEDMSFNGKAEFCAEMWVAPNVTSETHKTYGGTLLSKYNRGRMGQFFMSVEHSGDLFFHRETPPWGLRSHGVHIPPGVFTHLAVCYGSGRSKMFINGTLRGSQLEDGVAADDTTPLLIGAIHDHGSASGGFHGLIDELRIWSVDRSQMEIQSTMHVSLTGAEFGLEAYWSFDECAGSAVRDQLGRHDGTAHGGLWHESPVELYDASKLAQAEASSQQQLDDLVVKGEKVNFDYWKRSVTILEDQIRINKLLLKRKHEFAELVRRVKLLERRDAECGALVGDMNARNFNISAGVEQLQHNLTAHQQATGVYGDVSATSLNLTALLIDDGVAAASWLDAMSAPHVAQQEVWLSYEEQTEEEELLDEGVAFAMLDAEGQKAFKDRNRAKREVLPAIELAAKAGFEADDNTLSTLQSFNKGTFNKHTADEEDADEEYVELLQMKGYGASRIQALLKKRRASNRAMEGDADLPLAELLARSAVAGLLEPRGGKTGKRGVVKKKQGLVEEEGEIALNEEERMFAAFEDSVEEEEARWEPEPADEEHEGADEGDGDERPQPKQKKVAKVEPVRGGASERRSNPDEDEYYGDVDDGFAAVEVDGEKEEKTRDLKPKIVHDEKHPVAHKIEEPSKHSEPQPTKSIAQAAEDLLVDTLVAGMVPRVTEMLKLDVEEDRMPSEEDAQTELSAEKQEEEAAQARAEQEAEAEEDAGAFGVVSEMPEALKEQLAQEEKAFSTEPRQRARATARSRVKLEGGPVGAAGSVKHLVGEAATKQPAPWRTEETAQTFKLANTPDIK